MKKQKKPEWAMQLVSEELINKSVEAFRKPDESEGPLKSPKFLADILEKIKGRTNEEVVEVLSMMYTILPKEAQEVVGFVFMPLEAKAAMLVAHFTGNKKIE